MKIYLYDSISSAPQDDGDHILVFAGKGSLLKSDTQGLLTEVLCSYRIGSASIEFPRNGDAENVRFEQALSWAVKYAKRYGIGKVYGVFELNRPLDVQYLNRTFPGGITDKRPSPSPTSEKSTPVTICPTCGNEIDSNETEFQHSANISPKHNALTPCAQLL